MDSLTRRQIRYLCFRLRTEAEGGAKATSDMTKEMKANLKEVQAFYEDAEGFTSWATFAETWDISKRDHTIIVPRATSIWNDWQKQLEETVPELPVTKKGKKLSKKKG